MDLELPVGLPGISREALAALNERLRLIANHVRGWDQDAGGKRIRNLGAPVDPTDALNLRFADNRFMRIGTQLQAGAGSGPGAGPVAVEGKPGPPGPPGDSGNVILSRDTVDYVGAVSRSIDDILGEIPSFRSFGAVGDGTTNDQPAMQAAVNEIAARGGGAILMPGGYTFKLNASLEVPANVHLVGQGETSIIKRGADMADGKGVIHLAGGRNLLRDFLIEGDVTTATPLVYGSTVPGNPGDVVLTKNTSIWVEGCSHIVIENITIQHTGGYPILLDARAASVNDVYIDGLWLRNNRPHRFGLTAGSEDYGSWTGGILALGDGSHNARSIRIVNSDFQRGTGNQIWSWTPDLSGVLHADWIIDHCTFEDIGRDCVLVGGAVNWVISNCTARRIGYMTATDSDAGVPRWLANNWAVAFDTSGLAINCSLSNCVVTNAIGGVMDADGWSQGTITGLVARKSRPGEAEYAEDNVAGWTHDCYGLNLGDTQNNVGGLGVLVTNCYFDNMGYGAIRMYGSQKCTVALNLIIHPAAPTIGPIGFGPLVGTNSGCGENCITANTIHYPAASAAPAIYEDESISTNWTGANHVFGNRIIGTNAYEFLAVAGSGSKTSIVLSTASPATSRDEMQMQVEGTGAGKALKVYAVAAAAVAQVLSLTENGRLNVSDNGGDGTGAVMTGNRTNVAFDDTVATRHVIGDGFIAFKGDAFSATNANALGSDWFLLRKGATEWEQSISVSAGSRVWTSLGTGGVGSTPVPGSDNWLVFNDAGAWGADAGLRYNKTLNLLAIDGSAGQAGVALAAGWMQAPGFLALGAAADAINVPGGGVTALSLISSRADGASGLTLTRPAVRTWGMGVDAAGQLFVRDETAAANRLVFDQTTGRASFGAQVVVAGVAGGAGVTVSNGYVDAFDGFYTGNGSYQQVQAPAGGMFARSLRASHYITTGAGFVPPAATTGDTIQAGSIWYNLGAGQLQVHNGSGWTPIGGGAVSSVSSLSPNLTASPTTGAVQLNFSTSPSFSTVLTSGAISAGGVVTASGGFNYTGFAANGIQAQGGGVAASSINIANGFGGWQTAIDASRNVYAASLKATNGLDLIDSSGVFRGNGMDTFFAATAGAFNIKDFFGTRFGRTFTLQVVDAFGTAQTLIFRNGILTQT